MSGFDTICPGCNYRRISYEAKAEDYGQDGTGFYCAKSEHGLTRCPRAAEWRRYFKVKREADAAQKGEAK